MTREIDHVKSLYPGAHFVGIADGAKSNWDFLGPHIDEQVLDFYHVSRPNRLVRIFFGNVTMPQ